MRPRHRVTRAAIELIKRFEGYRSRAVQLPDGRWTIGYGHTLTAREGAEVSEEDAEALLLYDLIAIAHAVNESVFATLTPNQFDALCAFAFNIGLDNFRQSAVLKRVNEGALIQAAFAMELWRKAHFAGERIVVDALVRRRAAEKLLFLTPQGGWTPSPSPVLKPILDLDGADSTPKQTPAPLVATVEDEQLRLRLDGEPAPAEPAEAPPPHVVERAAEAVTQRLQTIYPDSGEAPQEPASSPPSFDIPAAEVPPVQDDLEVPPVPLQPAEAAASDEDFGGSEPSPFARVAPANDGSAAEPADAPEAEAEPAEPRRVIDDLSPFAPASPVVHPLPEGQREGVGSLLFLAILGLAFFGGGIFWAANARDTHVGALTPLSVGLMAGLAGIGFFCVAVYLLLQRLAQAAERRSRTRRG